MSDDAGDVMQREIDAGLAMQRRHVRRLEELAATLEGPVKVADFASILRELVTIQLEQSRGSLLMGERMLARMEESKKHATAPAYELGAPPPAYTGPVFPGAPAPPPPLVLVRGRGRRPLTNGHGAGPNPFAEMNAREAAELRWSTQIAATPPLRPPPDHCTDEPPRLYASRYRDMRYEARCTCGAFTTWRTTPGEGWDGWTKP